MRHRSLIYLTMGWLLAIHFTLASNENSKAAEIAPEHADVIIYGGTAAAVTAAIESKKLGKTVIIVSPDKHLGGLSSGGLGWTDSGNKEVVGGLAREFYHRVWKHYENKDAWNWQPRTSYGNKGQGDVAIDGEQRTMWIFEPHVAEAIFDDWMKEFDVAVYRETRLDRNNGLKVVDGNIESIRSVGGRTFIGKAFIDATYEGDLMAAAEVSYHVGREANAQYGEQWNGVQTGVLHHGHHFGVLPNGISPYVTPGDASSGVLPRISTDPPGDFGAADRRVQAYCFRMCLTNHEANRVPFAKPEGYDARQYELLRRIFDTGWRKQFEKFDPIPNFKTDTNNHGPFSTDNIGFNYDYPDANYERREEIIAEHKRYQQGLMYFLANDPSVPEDVRLAMSQWGLAKDEFVDNDHWPHQIYVREARRMVGKFVMTENELLKKRPTPESIGMGSYTIDSHNVQRYITPEGFVQNEGDIGVPTRGPYQIALGAILPQENEIKNLVVPVCVSSTHIAFGSIRMEPVFMILGESAAAVASMAIEGKTAVQKVPYEALRERLLQSGQVLEYNKTSPRSTSADSLPGIVVDDSQAIRTGNWASSHASQEWIGDGYVHDGNNKALVSSIQFEAKLPASGLYRIAISYPPNKNRSKDVPVTIRHGKDLQTVRIDQTKRMESDRFVSLGTFYFDSTMPAIVTISNEKTVGYVVADAVQWLGVEE